MSVGLAQWTPEDDRRERWERLNSERRVRVVGICPELLLLFIRAGVHEAQGIPADALIQDYSWDNVSNVLWIRVLHESFEALATQAYITEQVVRWQPHHCPAQQPVKFREFF